VKIENPADMPIVVQAVMLSSYPNPELALDLLSERCGHLTYVFQYQSQEMHYFKILQYNEIGVDIISFSNKDLLFMYCCVTEWISTLM
jgi:hypothetical protein